MISRWFGTCRDDIIPATRFEGRRTPLRIGFFIADLGDGGAQRQCALLANELARRREFEVVLIRYRAGIHDDLVNLGAVRICEVAVSSNFDPRAILRIRAVLKRERVNFLVSWLHPADAVAFFSRLLIPQLKWILMERDSKYPEGLRYRFRLYAGRWADAVVCNSLAGAKLWQTVRARGRIFTLNNIVMADGGGSVAPRERFRVLIVGRLEEQKNPMTCALAVIQCAKRLPEFEFEFDFVGDGSLRAEIEALVADHDQSGGVKILGFRKDVAHLLHESVALLTLSTHEGLPNAVLEAIGARVPIVASAIPEHLEILGVDYPFLVGDPRDVNDAVDQLFRILGGDLPSPEELFSFADARIAAMRADRVADQYSTILKEVLGA